MLKSHVLIQRSFLYIFTLHETGTVYFSNNCTLYPMENSVLHISWIACTTPKCKLESDEILGFFIYWYIFSTNNARFIEYPFNHLQPCTQIINSTRLYVHWEYFHELKTVGALLNMTFYLNECKYYFHCIN